MIHPVNALIASRVSANYFDAARAVSDAQVAELVRLATLAPSAYNFQNWRFVAVRSRAAKERLKAVSFGQHKVVDAPLTFIICGTLDAHAQLAPALQPAVDAGILDAGTVSAWVNMATRSHTGNAQLQRDEAVRSASLAAMTLILAAEGMGLSTCAMSGFDADGIVREFELAALDVPVMLVAVGYAADGNWQQKPRKPVHEVLAFA